MKIRRFISSVLIVLILMSGLPIGTFAAELGSEQDNVENVNSISTENNVNSSENDEKDLSDVQDGADTQSDDEEASGSEDEKNNSSEEINSEEQTLSSSEEESQEVVTKSTNSASAESKSVNSLAAQSTDSETTESTSEEGFKVALRWGGTSSQNYTWNAEEKEDRVIKLTFYYQNENAAKEYMPGDIQVTIPGIGNLNRKSTKKASDIAADEYGSTELTRDWSYRYDAETDTYTFYNNKEIEKGATFNGSFEMLWEFSSRDCVNGYTEKLQATLKSEDEIVVSQELSLEYTSKGDTFYIEKSAESLISADGLSKFVEDGKKVSNYAWVEYTFKYNVEDLNARALKNRYVIETFPEGCIIAKDKNVIKNEDGTVSYKVEEESIQDNESYKYYIKEETVIVGYPEEYANTNIKSVVDLYGTYNDEEEETKLATSEINVLLLKINESGSGYAILPEKDMQPYEIYRDSLEKDVSFTATLKATTIVAPIDQSEYGIAITDDLLEIYTDDYYRLEDDEYEFTKITVPGKNSFYNINGYELADGDYNVKIKVLYRENVNTRGLNEYTTVYEGKWEDQSISQSVEGAVAVRVEISGLTESLKSFYIQARGKINISESEYENPSYFINHAFTELIDESGNSITRDVVKEDYSQPRLYEQDYEIYGKGVARASDLIKILDNRKGEYYAYAEVESFEVDKEIENFITRQTHSVSVRNTQEKEITKIKIYGVNEKEDLETLIETFKFTYSNLQFKNYLSDDVDMQDYLRERASIEKNGKEITVIFDLEDNPIVAKNFSIGYKVESNVSYEEYYDESDPTYLVKTYATLEDSDFDIPITGTYNGVKMAYDSDTANILLALASHQQLIKAVKTEYTNGEFVEEGAVVPLNTEYTYRLKLRNGYNTLVNTEFIEILEHAELTKVDEEYPYSKSEWYGKLKNVDTKYIESKGLSAKVYYANTLEPDENSWTLMESYNDGIWKTVNEALAIKVAVEGEILENSIVHVDINMVAPNDESLIDKYAYNTYTLNASAIDLYTGLQASRLSSIPSNKTEVRLTKKEYNVEISKIDATSGSKLVGVQFGIYDEEGNKIRTNLTGILGDTTVKAIKEGTYTIKEEVVPLGYEQAEDFTLTIENGSYILKQGEEIKAEGEASLEGTIPKINLSIENKRAKGSITVYKIDEYLDQNKQELPLQGVEFELLDTENNVLAEGITDENGIIVFENLDWGKTYVIKEKQALKGYEVAIENTYLSKLNKDKIVTIENIRKIGSVTLTKVDKEDKTKLEGATYGLYARNAIYNKDGEIVYEKDQLIEKGTTNEEGEISVKGLVWGDYYFKELETIYGYELSKSRYTFTINAKNVENTTKLTVWEIRSKANLQLVKIDDDGNLLQGAEFTLFGEDGTEVQEDILTDVNGQLNIEGIEWGTYYIQETKSPQGYEENNTKYYFTVTRDTFLNGNNVVSIVKKEETGEEISIIQNNRKKGKVTLTKYSCNASGEETTNTLEGAVYELYSADGTKIGEYTSDKNGEIIVENLEWKSYYFQEIKAPEGYSVSNKKISFVVNSKNVDFEQELKAYDKQESGEIKINKTIKVGSLEAGHGNATFMFKIVGKDENDEEKVTLYRTVTFSNNDKESADSEGNITKSIIISDIEPYKYEITEEENFRYELNSIIPVTNAEVNSKTGIINLLGAENKGEITFINEKVNNSLLTDNKMMTNTAQNEYYILGIGAQPKQESYQTGTTLTASDFTFTLYYSGGQELEIELTEGVTFDGESEYTQYSDGEYIINIEGIYNGKTYNMEAITKWIIPSDYFTFNNISSAEKTIQITGINSKYTSPTVLYIPNQYKGYKVQMIINLENISNVKNVMIEEGLETIGVRAFEGCTTLTSIEIPNSVTSIASSAFEGCTSLTSVEIPDSVTTIENYAFEDCSKLTIIEIPSSVTRIGDFVFNGCSSLTSIEVDEDNKKYTSIDGVLYNKDKTILIKYPEGKKDLTEYKIEDSVTRIENYAFYNCSSLTSIEMPKGVTSIGYNAFYGCSNLTSIEIPGAVTSIGSDAFYRCSKLANIKISEGVTRIGSNAFYGCSSLTNIEVPSTVTKIGTTVFASCTKLANIQVDEANEEYVSIDGVLYDKEKTKIMRYPPKKEGTSYEIENSVTSIEDYAFQGCSTLTTIETPEGLTNIGNYAFQGCNKLTSIEIPKGVTKIGNSAFYGCSSLTSIEIPEGVTSIGIDAFYSCRGLTSVKIGEGISYIEMRAFRLCSRLQTIEIPNTVTRIRSEAFSGSNILKTINYHGTAQEFSKIIVESGNSSFLKATVNYIQD